MAPIACPSCRARGLSAEQCDHWSPLPESNRQRRERLAATILAGFCAGIQYTPGTLIHAEMAQDSVYLADELIKALHTCQDEGCPHYGTEHDHI